MSLSQLHPAPSQTNCGWGGGSMVACKRHRALVPSGGLPLTASLAPVDIAPRREWGKRAWGQDLGVGSEGRS